MDLFKVTVTGYVDLCSNMLVRSTICAMVFMVTGIVLAQAPPCRTFIHGTFEEGTRTKQEIISGNKEGIRILRRGNSHVETNRATRHKVRYTVRWISDCVLELTNPRVKKEGSVKVDPPADTITITITDTWNYGYAYTRSFSGSDRSETGAMKMVIPHGAGISFGL
ncbi:MAG: hypothetical protein IPI00_10480 [Flavobacteriales bacterium]|nr:hypothetical protein [Flavobacteriales bacterium]MBK7240586.1 hypothetical protein [Flavobacteriales bacterium]MBK9535935.1 hypothetical protein [Flavobacteriales bacterium]MBP9138886.1 hypothetical protein [Flavobacteriales bacterium]HQV51752.1 hypothetical protein [Flavobacteriales bacterium]